MDYINAIRSLSAGDWLDMGLFFAVVGCALWLCDRAVLWIDAHPWRGLLP